MTKTIPDSRYYHFVDGELVNKKTGWEFIDDPEEDIYDNGELK